MDFSSISQAPDFLEMIKQKAIEEKQAEQQQLPQNGDVEYLKSKLPQQPEQPIDWSPLQIGAKRVLSGLGDLFRQQNAMPGQDKIDAEIEQNRKYLKDKLLFDEAMEKKKPDSAVSLRLAQDLGTFYPEFKDSFTGRSYEENIARAPFIKSQMDAKEEAERAANRIALKEDERKYKEEQDAKERAQKLADEQKKLILNDYEPMEGATEESKRKFQSILENQIDVKNNSDSLYSFIQKHGANPLNPNTRIELESLIKQLATAYGRYQGLGALSAEDLKLAEAIKGGKYTTTAAAIASLDTLRKNMEANIKGKAEVYGYKKKPKFVTIGGKQVQVKE